MKSPTVGIYLLLLVAYIIDLYILFYAGILWFMVYLIFTIQLIRNILVHIFSRNTQHENLTTPHRQNIYRYLLLFIIPFFIGIIALFLRFDLKVFIGIIVLGILRIYSYVLART